MVANAGDFASWRYVDFFAANIRNPNTRRAYSRACHTFFAWCEDCGLTLTTIRPYDVTTCQFSKSTAANRQSPLQRAIREAQHEDFRRFLTSNPHCTAHDLTKCGFLHRTVTRIAEDCDRVNRCIPTATTAVDFGK
jgi:hypothetical protein